jgi:amino acid adenylation domain-containing protein
MKKIYFQKSLLESFQKYRDRIALEYGAREIKYSQLEKKCLSVSHWLLGHKTGKGSFIGIYIEDRVDFIAVLLGILNTGGVFIPLDTHLPVKRIEKMLQVIQPGLIICDQQGQRRLLHHLQTSINPEKIICISQVFNERDDLQLSLEDVVEYSSQDPIYVYFTSGTTGTPQAILGKNISLLHFINWEIQTFSINETFRVSQLTALGFDAFLRDLFVPLVVGGRLCIPKNPEILMDSESLIYWLETNLIGLVHCVPSIFRIFNTKALKKENFQHLKYILLSGESIIPQELKNWFDIMGDRIQLVNLYGPTETTMIKTCYYIKKEDVNRGRIPIGKPMKGARLILFDKNMKICEPGFIGDIYIRTPYRTFGYLNDPQLNLERFISNPLGGEQTDLLFKTGDQGLELSEGDFEFLGRRDRQVKIRGIRVELDEVERAMLQYPYLDNAAVIEREEKDRDKYLCAYFISRGTVEISELREYLSGNLPEYMIPNYFVPLAELPLTPNGKLDMKALPDPTAFIEAKEEYKPPQNETMEKLVEIWSEVLGIEKKVISIDSNFLQSGGHSLKVAIMASKIHKELKVELSLADFFKNPTIRALSRYIAATKKSSYTAIASVEKREYYQLSSAQKRLYILRQLDFNSTSYNITNTFYLPMKIEKEKVEEIFKLLINRHDSLRTSFVIIDQEPVQRIHEEKNPKFRITNYNHLPNHNHKLEITNIIKEFVRPFDLSQAPLLRVGYMKTNEKQFILFIDTHHIIADGFSLEILEKEFLALCEGKMPPPLRIKYKDYVHWQKSEKQQEVMKKQEKYWLKNFSGPLPVLKLSTDYPRPPVQTFAAQQVDLLLTEEEAQVIRDIAEEAQATVSMTILALLKVLFSKLSGKEDIVIGIPTEGRKHTDLHYVVGMFVNMLAIRNYPCGDKSFKEFMLEVKERTLEAFDNQDYQFEDLVKHVAPERQGNRNPIFDIAFNVKNIEKAAPPSHLEKTPPGTNIGEHVAPITRFDIILTILDYQGSFLFCFKYNATLFKLETINRHINYFKAIISSLKEDTGIKLKDLYISPGPGLLMAETSMVDQGDFVF